MTIYLDVDGVINPYKSKNPKKWWSDYRKYQTKPGVKTKIWLSKQLGEELANLPTEIVWATTWCEYANEYISPILGLGQLRVLDYLPAYDFSETSSGKLNVVREDAKNKHKIVWIDDDLGGEDLEWTNSRTEPTMTIKTIPSVGLTKNHIYDILDFLQD